MRTLWPARRRNSGLLRGGIRSAEEVNHLRETRDPVKICREKLLDQGVLSEEDVSRIQAEADAEVEAAEKFVDESPKHRSFHI